MMRITFLKLVALFTGLFLMTSCNSGDQANSLGSASLNESSTSTSSISLMKASAQDIAFNQVNCASDNDKQVCVAICHKPPGNPDNSKSMVLPLPAVLAHIKHGCASHAEHDHLGLCDGDSESDMENNEDSVDGSVSDENPDDDSASSDDNDDDNDSDTEEDNEGGKDSSGHGWHRHHNGQHQSGQRQCGRSKDHSQSHHQYQFVHHEHHFYHEVDNRNHGHQCGGHNPDASDGSTDPDSPDSGSSDPDSAGSGSSDPDSTDAGSGSSDPDSAGSGTNDPDSAGSGNSDPDSTDSGSTNPDSSGTGNTDPGSTDSGNTDPDPTDSGSNSDLPQYCLDTIAIDANCDGINDTTGEVIYPDNF